MSDHESGPTTRTLLALIREQEDANDAMTDGGVVEPTREELVERVDELERKMEHVTAHNRRDTAPEGRR